MVFTETPSICTVIEWLYGIESDCQLKIMYNQKCFLVTLSPSASQVETIEVHLLQKLDHAQRGSWSDEDEVLEEIADVVCESGLELFEQLAPPKLQAHLPIDLYSLLHPEIFYFQLVTLNSQAQLVRQYHQDLEAILSLLETATSALPTFSIRDIQVLETL